MSATTQRIEELMAQDVPQIVWRPIDATKENAKNPQITTNAEMQKLKKSIEDFPEMLVLRPGIVDATGTLLAGNKRHRACKELGWHMFPVIDATGMSQDQLDQLVIKDNLNFGKWDMAKLREEWDMAKLGEWGMDMTDVIAKAKIVGEQSIATEMNHAHNYVVLQFTDEADWEAVQVLLGLSTGYSKRENGTPWAYGVGRVVDGKKAIENIKASAQ